MVSQKSVLLLNLSTSKHGCLKQGNTSPGDVARRAPNEAHPFQVGKVKEVSHEALGLSKASRRSPRCKKGNPIPCNVSKRSPNRTHPFRVGKKKTLNSSRSTGAIHSPVGMFVVLFCALTNIVSGMEQIERALPETDVTSESVRKCFDTEEPSSAPGNLVAHGSTDANETYYSNPETDYDWVWHQLIDRDDGFLYNNSNDFYDEEILDLLDWKITGYSIGRKMQDNDKSFNDWKEYLGYYRENSIPLSIDDERKEDKRFHLNIHQTWWIYVRIQDPDSNAVKYIKLVLRKRHKYKMTKEELSKSKKYLANDTRRGSLFEKYNSLYQLNKSRIGITVYNNFAYENKQSGGCRIIDVPEETENSPHRTLFSILEAGSFKGTGADNQRENPIYANPEYFGDGRFPVINCITYVMRVIQTLGVERNPAGWSYLNKKRGRVFKVSELKSLQDDSYVMLDDLQGIYQIQQTDGALSAVLVQQSHASVDKIDLTVFEYQGEAYIKEVFKLCDGRGRSLDNDYGPRKLGIQRLTCWGDLHSEHLYSPYGTRQNLWEPVSFKNEPWFIWGRIFHKDGKHTGKPWIMSNDVRAILDRTQKPERMIQNDTYQRMQRENQLLYNLLQRR